MNEIQLAQLRDEAIELLPAAQKARDNFRQWSRVTHLGLQDYAMKLYAAATMARCDVTLPSLELAAANLLEAVSMWQMYAPNRPELEGIDPTEHRVYSMRKIAEAAEALAKVTGRDLPFDYTPAVKVATLPDTSPSGDDVEEQAPAADDYEETLAALFDPVPKEALEKMFPASGKWANWAERANRNGLKAARQGRKKFNPYIAGMWFVRNGAEGWDDARLYRALKNNLPARSRDEAHLFGGDLD